MSSVKEKQTLNKTGTVIAVLLIVLVVVGAIYVHHTYGEIDILIKEEINKYTDFFKTDKGNQNGT